MRDTFPGQFGHDACGEKDWFWKPDEWDLSVEAAKEVVGHGAPTEPFVAFSLESDGFNHYLCMARMVEMERDMFDTWTVSWKIRNPNKREEVYLSSVSSNDRRVCERAVALFMEIISEETLTKDDHFEDVRDRVSSKCSTWEDEKYRVFSGRELNKYEEAREKYEEQKLDELHERALEEKQRREERWRAKRADIHQKARRNHIHKKALQEWEEEKRSRKVVKEFEENLGSTYKIPVVDDEELEQLNQEYVSGEITLEQYEEKFEEIVEWESPISSDTEESPEVEQSGTSIFNRFRQKMAQTQRA